MVNKSGYVAFQTLECLAAPQRTGHSAPDHAPGAAAGDAQAEQNT